jgi:hypothetical protein
MHGDWCFIRPPRDSYLDAVVVHPDSTIAPAPKGAQYYL